MKKYFCYGKKDFCTSFECDKGVDCAHYDGSGGEDRDAPMTNADRIRSMTDEELAKLLCCTGWRMIEKKSALNGSSSQPERRTSMRLIDSVMMNAGATVLITGGCLLIVAGVGLAALLVANIWIAASNKWRRILRAESLIYEYRKNRDEFMRWKHEQTD